MPRPDEQLWLLLETISGFIKHAMNRRDPEWAQRAWHRATNIAQGIILGIEISRQEEIRQSELLRQQQEDTPSDS